MADSSQAAIKSDRMFNKHTDIYFSVQQHGLTIMSAKDLDRAGRLIAERRRLGLSQRAAAEIVQCSEQAWIRYEKGSGMKQEQVDALQEAGWNMVWVVFGDDAPALLPDHDPLTMELLSLWRSVDQHHLSGLLLLVRTYAATYPITPRPARS